MPHFNSDLNTRLNRTQWFYQLISGISRQWQWRCSVHHRGLTTGSSSEGGQPSLAASSDSGVGGAVSVSGGLSSFETGGAATFEAGGTGDFYSSTIADNTTLRRWGKYHCSLDIVININEVDSNAHHFVTLISWVELTDVLSSEVWPLQNNFRVVKYLIRPKH